MTRATWHAIGLVVVLHGLEDVLADGLAGIEVGQLQVGELGTQLVADVVTRGLRELSDLAEEPPGLSREVGQPVGTENHDRDHEEHKELRETDSEHRSESTGRR